MATLATGLVALSMLVLPRTPLARVLGFVPLALYGAVLGIAGAHVVQRSSC